MGSLVHTFGRCTDRLQPDFRVQVSSFSEVENWGALPFSISVLSATLSLLTLLTDSLLYSIGQSGLAFSAQCIGACIGLVIDHYCEKLYQRHVKKHGPEARLYNTMVGGVCVPVGVLIFTFTSYSSLHWSGACVGIGVLFTGLYLIYASCFSYIADRYVRAPFRRSALTRSVRSYTLYASSALSAMSFFRNLVGSLFPLFTTSLYNKLGVQGAGGLTAGLSALLALTPFLLYRYGARLRARSPFAKELALLARLREEKVALASGSVAV